MSSVPALPTLNEFDAYAFPVTLPSTGKQIKMRPYLVREEKLLLMAQESNNVDEQAEAIGQIIKNCTLGLVEPATAPFFDIEYLLLQLRARSVGDIASPVYQCNNVLEDGSTCQNQTSIKVKLTEIPVKNIPTNEDSLKLVISPKWTLWLRYPSIYTVNTMFQATMNNGGNRASAIDALADLFDKLENSETKVVWNFSEYNQAEKIAFLENLAPSDYEKVITFFEGMPTLEHTIEYKCSKCGYDHNIKLAGLSDFLV